MIYTKEQLLRGLFININTVPKYLETSKLPEPLKELWADKYNSRYSEHNDLMEDEILEKYGNRIPEYSQISAYSIGFFNLNNDKLEIQAETVLVTDALSEKQVLTNIATLLNDTKLKAMIPAGYNINNFVIPYLYKKYIINKMDVPKMINIKGQKPWEVDNIDVMKDYQGLYYEHVPLNVACHVMGVDCSDGPEAEMNAIMELAVSLS